MQTLNADGHGRTVALVRAILGQNSMSAAFDADTRFVELGLTSMDMVDLMLRVEAEFDITIPPCEITAENFVSVATLQVMIDRQLAAAIAA